MANCTKFREAQERHAKKSHPKCDLQPQMLYCNVRCTDASSDVAN